MINKTYTELTEPMKSALKPVWKFNSQAVEAVEKLAAHQLESLKAYLDMGVGQLKAAAEVKDVDSLQNFLHKQNDVLRTFGKCALSDIKAVTQVSAGFFSQTMPTMKAGAKEAPVTPEKIEVA